MQNSRQMISNMGKQPPPTKKLPRYRRSWRTLTRKNPKKRNLPVFHKCPADAQHTGIPAFARACPHIHTYQPIPRGYTVPMAGRSSDLSLITPLRLPGKYPSDAHRSLPFTGIHPNLESCGGSRTLLLQRRDRAGLSPASLFTEPSAILPRSPAPVMS